MRSGFSVCAEACRCHAVLPKKFRRSRICKRKFATLLSFATSAANSSTSPERRGPPVSGVAGGSAAELAGFPAAARERGFPETERPQEAPTVDTAARAYWGAAPQPRPQKPAPAAKPKAATTT